MKKISINIQAHPKRKDFIPYLKSRLGNVPVIWDKKNDVWDTRVRCMEDHIKKGAKWALTIQDDALLPKDFLKKVDAFISKQKVPRDRKYAINFYFSSQSDSLVLRMKRRGYFKALGMRGGVAICLPTEMLPAIIEMWKGKEELSRHDDSRIGKYLRSRRLKTYYPVPSMVQHRDSPSLIYKPGEMPEVRQAIVYDHKQFE